MEGLNETTIIALCGIAVLALYAVLWWLASFETPLFVQMLLAVGVGVAIVLLALGLTAKPAAAKATLPCIHIPNPGDPNAAHKAWTCPVPGTNHWLIVRQVYYGPKVIGVRVVKLVP